MMHLSGVFRFRHMFDHANAARVSQERLPIFDTHVHYKEPAWEVYPPDTIINLLKNTGVVKALVSSTPDEGTRMLYKEDPERIVPFLRPYHDDINSSNWYLKDRVFPYILERLEMPIYKGVGEFHIHNPLDADSPIIKKTVDWRLSVICLFMCIQTIERWKPYFPMSLTSKSSGPMPECPILRKLYRGCSIATKISG